MSPARREAPAPRARTGPASVEVVRVTTRAQLEAAWAVRTTVFVQEQGVPVEEEVDDLDTAPTTRHVLAVTPDGSAVGTGRLLADPAHPGEVHLGRLAVLADHRGTGLGARLVRAIEDLALVEHGAPEPDGRRAVTVVLAAQESAMAFYGRLDYAVRTGERYLDAGIWHQDMARTVRG